MSLLSAAAASRTPTPPTRVAMVTAPTFAPLRAWAVAAAADPTVTLVVQRRHLRDALLAACHAAHGARRGLAARVLTTNEVLKTAQERLEGEFQLTGVMRREMVRGLLQRQGETAVAIAWPGGWQTEAAQPADWVVDRVSGLLEQLALTRATIAQLRRLARLETDPTQRARKRLMAHLYRAWLHLTNDAGLYPQTEAVRRAAHLTPTLARPHWLGERLVLVGWDGTRQGSAELRLLEQLVGPSALGLEAVTVCMVAPDPAAPRGWESHGNDALEQTLLAVGATVERLAAPSDPSRTPALEALHQDPTAYALPPAAWDNRQVRILRYADPQQEARAIADRIKRLCVTEQRRPEEIAVIGRGLGSQSALLQRALREVGVPVVASGQTRLRDVPAVQYLRAWATLAAEGPRMDLLERLSGTGYLPQGPLDLVTLRQAQTQWGLDLRTWDDWHQALSLLGGEAAAAARTQLAALADVVASVWPAAAPIGERVAALQMWLRTTDFERQIHQLPAHVPATVVAVHDLVRADLEAAQGCMTALEGWVRGAELAHTADLPLTAAAFASGLERIAQDETLRLSTWAEEGVALLDPHQAILRQWPIVFILGLTDGVWPGRPDPVLEDWDDAARRLLGLTPETERLAHDRLVFHAACAAATELLEFSAPASDALGGALGVSPYLTGLSLRLLGAEVAPPLQEIRDWAPRGASGATSHLQAAIAAAREARAGVVDPWLQQPTGRLVVERWQQEALRRGDVAAMDPRSSRFQAQIAELMPTIWPETKAFTPGDLELYRSCPMRFWQQRILGLQGGDTQIGDDETPALAGILRDVLGPVAQIADAAQGGPAALDPVSFLARVEHETRRVSARARGRLSAGVWQLDQEPLVDILQRFAQREWLGRPTRDLGLATKLVEVNRIAGTADEPVVIQPAGSRPWLLEARLDRVEQIADPRLVDHPRLSALNGMLIVSQYRPVQSRAAYVKMPLQWVKGDAIQLPLLAKAASLRAGGARVFGMVERTPLLPSDPTPLVVRTVSEAPTGEIELQPMDLGTRGVGALESVKRDPVQHAIDRAVEVATVQVEGIRRGDFAPPESPPCWTCPLARSCRASVKPDGAHVRRRRAPLPLAVTRLAATPASEA